MVRAIVSRVVRYVLSILVADFVWGFGGDGGFLSSSPLVWLAVLLGAWVAAEAARYDYLKERSLPGGPRRFRAPGNGRRSDEEASGWLGLVRSVLKSFSINLAVLWFGVIACLSLAELLGSGILTSEYFFFVLREVCSPTSVATICLIGWTAVDVVDSVGALCERRGETFRQLVCGELRKRFGRHGS